MKKICLVEGGGFSLGIDVRNIVSRTTYGDTARTGADMFDLGSLLSCRPFDTPKSDMTCLRLQTDTGVLFLLVDQVVKEIEITEPPVPLPSSSPPLAGQLCPKAVIHENSVVLLLEPTQVVPVCKRLGNDIGRIRLPLSSEGIDSVPPEKKKVAVSSESAAKYRSIAPRQPSNQEIKKQKIASIDEDTVKDVMSWTVSRFKARKNGEELHLGIDQLPPILAEKVRRKGLSNNIIQYLIEQILVRCRATVHREIAGGRNAG